MGKYEGKGEFIWKDNVKYIGDFKDNKMKGQGELIWTNGDSYKGGFDDGKFEGFGIETKNNKIYEGNFKNDLYEGKGIRKYPNGDRYEGDFHEGFFEGKGIWYYSDESRLEAVWVKGKKNGIAKKYMKNGDIYEITYENVEKIDIRKLPH